MTLHLPPPLTAPNSSLKWSNFPGMIGAGIAESDFGTAPTVLSAIHAAVDRDLLAYVPDREHARLRTATSRFIRERYDWSITADDVRIVSDVLAGFEATIAYFSAPGSPVIVPTPTYPPFLQIPHRMGREVVEVPMRWDASEGYSLDLDAIEAALSSNGRDGGVVVLCNPHNPTGLVHAPQQMTELATVIDRHGARVFADEIHAPVVYREARHVPYASTSALAASHTITATSTSKGWNLAGLKCAQVVLSSEQDRERWDQLGLFPVHANSILGVVAATAAYTAGVSWLDQAVSRFDQQRHLLADLIHEHLAPEVWPRLPQATYLAWLDLRRYGLGPHPAEALARRAGVILSDGLACGDTGTGFARFNFAMPEEHLRAAVVRIASAVNKI